MKLAKNYSKIDKSPPLSVGMAAIHTTSSLEKEILPKVFFWRGGDTAVNTNISHCCDRTTKVFFRSVGNRVFFKCLHFLRIAMKLDIASVCEWALFSANHWNSLIIKRCTLPKPRGLGDGFIIHNTRVSKYGWHFHSTNN